MHNAEHTYVARSRIHLFPYKYLVPCLKKDHVTHLTLEWGYDGDRASYKRLDGALRKRFFRHCDSNCNRGSLGVFNDSSTIPPSRPSDKYEHHNHARSAPYATTLKPEYVAIQYVPFNAESLPIGPFV